jgi:hypothetical protein
MKTLCLISNINEDIQLDICRNLSGDWVLELTRWSEVSNSEPQTFTDIVFPLNDKSVKVIRESLSDWDWSE